MTEKIPQVYQKYFSDNSLEFLLRDVADWLDEEVISINDVVLQYHINDDYWSFIIYFG